LKPKLEEYRIRHPKNIFIEGVDVPPRKGVQQAFAFFYYALVYTGTTKTLATMAMRPGEAPGGGRRWLAPVKWAIARTFGSVRFLSEPMVEYLYGLLFPRFFSDVFAQYQPDLVFVPNLHHRFDQEVSREAKNRSIKRIGMVLNWDHYDKYFLPFLPRELLVQSEQLKDFATRYQNRDRKNLTLVGYPFLDHLNDPTCISTRDSVLRDLGFPPDAKYILYVAGSMYSPDESDVIEKMVQWADSNELGANMYFVIRPYQGGRGKDSKFDEEKFQTLSSHPRVSFKMDQFWAGFETNVPFMNILRHADVVMAVYSTAVLPAVALDRPSMTLGFDGMRTLPYKQSIRRYALRVHFRDVIDSGAQYETRSFDDLKAKLRQYIAYPSMDHEKRQRLIVRAVGPLDGKASERVAHAILSRLQLS
jgi:hypothetical protein